MTHIEKIESLKSTIEFMHTKEGRSINYMSKLLGVNRGSLSKYIKSWGFKKKEKAFTPSVRKFFNKNRKFIEKKINEDVSVQEIANLLNTNRDKIYYLIERDEELELCLRRARDRRTQKTELKKAKMLEKSNRNYIHEDLENEIWKDILGYPEYQVSNMGRVKRYAKKNNEYYEIIPMKNVRTNRHYISLINDCGKRKNLLLHRIVCFSFVEGYSEENNTVNHIDGDTDNNSSSNLEWGSQSKNNKNSYDMLERKKSLAYSKYGKFKAILIDEQYEFKTIVSASKFLGISATQFNRIVNGVCGSERKIEFIY